MLSEGGGVALTPEDRARLLRLREHLLDRGEDIVGRFYEEMDSRPTFSRHLPTGERRVRLRRLQTDYFDELLTGSRGEAYRARRVAVGEAHQRVGLPQRLYTESYAIYLDLLSEAAIEVLGPSNPELAPTLRALGLAVLLDIGLVQQAWAHAQRQSEQRLREGEVARAAHGVAQRLIDSALPAAMDTKPINVCALARGLAPLLPGMLPDGIELELDCEDAERVVLIDPGQLERVLLGLIDNAIEALPDGDRLALHIGGHRLDDVDARLGAPGGGLPLRRGRRRRRGAERGRAEAHLRAALRRRPNIADPADCVVDRSCRRWADSGLEPGG